MKNLIILAAIGSLLACIFPAQLRAEAVPVRVVHTATGWQLTRGGQPYFIKGAGGGGSKTLLAACGGNSFRTWGVGKDTTDQLDEAQKLGMTVSLGIWLAHKGPHFNYDDSAAVRKQFDDAKANVQKYKDAPALLIWSLGNEMEAGNDSPALWNAIEDLAKMVHEIDPNHPAMTVVQDIGGKKIDHIKQLCPDLDIIGINTYAGGPSLAERYQKAGLAKPYIVTEFGPPGPWDMKRNHIGAVDELTSTEKAGIYRTIYEKSVSGDADLCLGSYAFTWGYKIEATATWYGLLLPDGSKLGAVDVMTALWTGKPPEHPCPNIEKLSLLTSNEAEPGKSIKAAVETSDPEHGKLEIHWSLLKELHDYDNTGAGAKPPPELEAAITTNGQPTVDITAPAQPGIDRIYVYVRNAHDSAATGSIVIRVKRSN